MTATPSRATARASKACSPASSAGRDQSDGDTHWRSISRDNVTTLYGKTEASRIADPADPRRVFSWLICESYDDKGNAILYTYAAENDDGRRSCASQRTQPRAYGQPLPRSASSMATASRA